MTDKFPYGGSQTLTCGSVTMNLDDCEFFSTDDLPAGYDRRYIEDQLLDVTYSVTGVPTLRTTCFTPKYTFRWNLFLPADKVATLYALLAEQRYRTQSKLSDYYIVLQDNRLIEIERTPTTRESTGMLLEDTTVYDIPAGFDVYFPVFRIKIDEPVGWTNWLFQLNDKMHYQVELTAQELSLQPA